MGLRARAAGFSLIELTVSIGIAVIVSLALFFSLRNFLLWNALLNQRDREHAALAALADRWQAEADSAWAIFTPPADVNGRGNGDGHELDFFMRDGSNRDHFWAYTYDKPSKTLQKYLYATPGAVPQTDGLPIDGITSFVAQTYPVTDLQNAASPIYNGLYASANLRAAAIHFGYGNAIAGGNQITYVQVDGASIARTLELATRTAPSGFTVVLHYTPAP
ncbi:MAG: PulJ/GspJ family protein [Vulcanimicrobiaceae bacterium]